MRSAQQSSDLLEFNTLQYFIIYNKISVGYQRYKSASPYVYHFCVCRKG